jgi:hypothetical protein
MTVGSTTLVAEERSVIADIQEQNLTRQRLTVVT